MLTHIIWWIGFALEVLILGRGWKTRLAKRFPLFHFYITCVLLTSVFRFFIYNLRPNFYKDAYWSSELVSIIMGYAVVIEIYERSLELYAGVARLAQTILISILVLVLINAFVFRMGPASTSFARLTSGLERDLRLVQAALFMVLLALLAYYRVPTDRNVRGLILGYGFFVGFRIIQLTVRPWLGNYSTLLQQEFQPFAYSLALLTWASFLWSFSSERHRAMPEEMQRDYESLVANTRFTLSRARSYLIRGIRT